MVGQGKTCKTLTKALKAVASDARTGGAPVATQYVCAPNGDRCIAKFSIEITGTTTVTRKQGALRNSSQSYGRRFSFAEMRRAFQNHHKEWHGNRARGPTIFANYIYRTSSSYVLPSGEITQYVAIQHHPGNHPHFRDGEGPPNTQGHFHVRPVSIRSDGFFIILDTSKPQFDHFSPQEHYWYREHNGGRDFWYAEEESGTCSSGKQQVKDDRGKDGGAGAAGAAGGQALHKVAERVGYLAKSPVGVVAKECLTVAVKRCAMKGTVNSIKKVPGVSLLVGWVFAIGRIASGDFLGAVGEVASGVVACTPGHGTAASLCIDGLLAANDLGLLAQRNRGPS